MDPYGPAAASGELSAATQEGGGGWGKKGYLPSSPSEYLPLPVLIPSALRLTQGADLLGKKISQSI